MAVDIRSHSGTYLHTSFDANEATRIQPEQNLASGHKAEALYRLIFQE